MISMYQHISTYIYFGKLWHIPVYIFLTLAAPTPDQNDSAGPALSQPHPSHTTHIHLQRVSKRFKLALWHIVFPIRDLTNWSNPELVSCHNIAHISHMNNTGLIDGDSSLPTASTLRSRFQAQSSCQETGSRRWSLVWTSREAWWDIT